MPDSNSGIYKIDGWRILAASAQRALADGNGDQIDTTYLKEADFTAASGKWDSAADLVTANSGDWNGVTAKLDTSAFTAFTADADVTEYSAGANIDITNHVVSGKDWTDDITGAADDASAAAVAEVSGNFEYNPGGEISGYAGSAFAGEAYSAGNGIDITNNVISVSGEYVTSAGDSLSGKMLVLKDNAWFELPEMGGFEVATGTGADLHPDVQDPSHKLIYLVKDSTVTSGDSYKEWIYSDSDNWELIGDTQMDLTNYASTAWVDENYVSTATAVNWDVTEYSGASGINVTGHEIGLAATYKSAVEAVSSKLDESAFTAFTADADVTEYSAGTNIDITNHVISGKDWNDDITAGSANAVTIVEGKFEYNTDNDITAYNGSAFYVPDTSEFVATAQYSTDSAVWQDAAATVSSNSGAWTHTFTIINVPDLSNVPDVAP